jgi:hypothetical protein
VQKKPTNPMIMLAVVTTVLVSTLGILPMIDDAAASGGAPGAPGAPGVTDLRTADSSGGGGGRGLSLPADGLAAPSVTSLPSADGIANGGGGGGGGATSGGSAGGGGGGGAGGGGIAINSPP